MTTLGAARVDAVKEVTGGEPPTRWVHLQHIQWVDERGRDRTWEAAVRANAQPMGSGVADAVAVLARLRYGNIADGDGSLGTVLVAQFRPPIGAITLELPAGLIDAGESPGQAAVRELKEETGFIGEVSRLSPVVYSSPGLTNESMQLVQIDVDMKTEENRTPVPEQEDSECIENIMGTPSGQLEHRVHINFADSIILLLRLQGFPVAPRIHCMYNEKAENADARFRCSLLLRRGGQPPRSDCDGDTCGVRAGADGKCGTGRIRWEDSRENRASCRQLRQFKKNEASKWTRGCGPSPQAWRWPGLADTIASDIVPTPVFAFFFSSYIYKIHNWTSLL